MIRFTARFLGFWLIAAALVAAVVDGAKSIAASSLVLTPLADTYARITAIGHPAAGAAGAAAATVAPPAAPWPLDLALAWLMASPTVAVLAVPGIILLVLGTRRRRPFLSREFAA
jgi:hypothetical protein